jgi:hypothetical protein
VPTCPTIEECDGRPHRAGWSLGKTAFGTPWQIDGSNGEDRILARGRFQREARWRACVQGRLLACSSVVGCLPPGLVGFV